LALLERFAISRSASARLEKPASLRRRP